MFECCRFAKRHQKLSFQLVDTSNLTLNLIEVTNLIFFVPFFNSFQQLKFNIKAVCTESVAEFSVVQHKLYGLVCSGL